MTYTTRGALETAEFLTNNKTKMASMLFRSCGRLSKHCSLSSSLRVKLSIDINN